MQPSPSHSPRWRGRLKPGVRPWQCAWTRCTTDVPRSAKCAWPRSSGRGVSISWQPRRKAPNTVIIPHGNEGVCVSHEGGTVRAVRSWTIFVAPIDDILTRLARVRRIYMKCLVEDVETGVRGHHVALQLCKIPVIDHKQSIESRRQ